MPIHRVRASNIVGVVVDGDMLRGTQIDDRVGRPRRVHCAEIEIRPDLTDHGRIVDHDGLADALRALWATAGFTTKQVAFGIDGRDATFRRMTLPITMADDVAAAARYELSSYLPYDLDEAITSVQEVGRTEATIDVVVVAVRRRSVENLATAVEKAGLGLRDVTLSSTALGASVGPGASQDTTIVSVDGASTVIVVRRDGRATVTRVLTGGGGERSVQTSDELEEALASVDQFRQGLGATVGRSEDPKVRRFRTVAEEVAAAIRFEESQQHGDTHPLGVDLTGAHGADETLVAQMAAVVDVPVRVVEPPPWWTEGQPFAAFATAAGVALGAFDRTGQAVHLDVPSIAAREGRRRELAVGLLAAVLVAVPATRLVDGSRQAADEADETAAVTESEADVLAARWASFEEVSELHAEVQDRRRMVESAVQGETWMPRLLDEVAHAIPDETFLTGLTLRRPSIAWGADDADATATFSGVALDQAGAAAWLLALDASDLVDDVWLVQSTASVYGEAEVPVVAFVAEGDLTAAATTPRAVDPGEAQP